MNKYKAISVEALADLLREDAEIKALYKAGIDEAWWGGYSEAVNSPQYIEAVTTPDAELTKDYPDVDKTLGKFEVIPYPSNEYSTHIHEHLQKCMKEAPEMFSSDITNLIQYSFFAGVTAFATFYKNHKK